MFLLLISRLQITSDSTVIIKIKKYDLSYFRSIILFDYLPFLFVLEVFQLQKWFKTTRIKLKKDMNTIVISGIHCEMGFYDLPQNYYYI